MLPTDMPKYTKYFIILLNIRAKLTRIFTSFFSHFFGDFWGATEESEYLLARLELCHEFSSYLIVFSIVFIFSVSFVYRLFFYVCESDYFGDVIFFFSPTPNIFVAAVGKKIYDYDGNYLRVTKRCDCALAKFVFCAAHSELVGVIDTH